MRTERGFDRIVNFSDATVAIAMTLLVLPLVDLVQPADRYENVWILLRENSDAIFGFVLGFLVIWTMWVAHHRTMEFFVTYDETVMTLHLIWLLTMVSIPFTTKLITDEDYYREGGTAVYVAVLLVSSLSLHLLGLRGRRRQKLLADTPEVTVWLGQRYTWTTVIVLAVVLVIVLIWPGVGAWPLLLLFVDGLVESRVRDRTVRGP